MTSLTGSRLSEWENWPFSTRKPPITGLCLLAEIYQCGVLDLIDVCDREKLATAELLALDKTSAAPSPGQHGHHQQAAAQAPAEPAKPGGLPPLTAPAPTGPPIPTASAATLIHDTGVHADGSRAAPDITPITAPMRSRLTGLQPVLTEVVGDDGINRLLRQDLTVRVP